MNTKNIFKTVALAMLMPAMLLTTACSNQDDIANTSNITNKGYALPVTVNVTRQDGATRATFDGSKLNFSTGDKLFVKANYSSAGQFAGLLDYDAGSGKFSGTIYTQSQYTGTVEALLAGASALMATLVPDGYGTNGYLSISNAGAYNADLSVVRNKVCALAKKEAVEQLSFESVDEYNNGFALVPRNGVVCFSISGLAANTAVEVIFKEKSADSATPVNVTTDVSGVATFAVGMENENFDDFSLTVDGNAIALPAAMNVVAGKIYKMSRSAAAAFVTFTYGTNTVKVAKMNLGATTVADSPETSYGNYYSWGATTTSTDYIEDNTPYYDSGAYTKYTSGLDATLEAADDAVAANMSGWHMPTRAEMQTLFNACGGSNSPTGTISADQAYPSTAGIYWVTGGNAAVKIGDDTYSVNGLLFVQDADHHVFFPAAGRFDSTYLDYAGEEGYYWSSSLCTERTNEAYYLYFYSDIVNPDYSGFRYYGYSVRPFKD